MSIPTEEHDCYVHYKLKAYEKLFHCDGCKMKGFGERYVCNLCGHELHKECRHPEEMISDENFGCSIFKFPEHDCYVHYELKAYEKLFHCDGCKMKGFGERYACNLCGHELHKECRHPEEMISHENFGCSIFKFLDEPFTRLDQKKRKVFSKYCDACGKDICGFNYHCEEDNLDLHPCCRKLEKKLEIDSTIFDLQTKVSSKCGKWRKKKVPGWSYVSQCKKYHFHVYCITEMVQEAYMKHGDMALKNMDLRELVINKIPLVERSFTGGPLTVEVVVTTPPVNTPCLINNRNGGGGNTFLTTIILGFQCRCGASLMWLALIGVFFLFYYFLKHVW